MRLRLDRVLCGLGLAVMAFSPVVAWWMVSAEAVHAQVQGVPLATPDDERHAQLAISRDGLEVTFRSVAPDALRVCFDPAPERFGPRRCFTVGQVRRGEVQAR